MIYVRLISPPTPWPTCTHKYHLGREIVIYHLDSLFGNQWHFYVYNVMEGESKTEVHVNTCMWESQESTIFNKGIPTRMGWGMVSSTIPFCVWDSSLQYFLENISVHLNPYLCWSGWCANCSKLKPTEIQHLIWMSQ